MNAQEKGPTTADEAWDLLMQGNRRYVEGQAVHPRQGRQRRVDLLHYQNPFAAVLGCADARVPPEILFDQGIGDIFVVRTAGNIADPGSALGSLEFAVAKLGTPLLVVLGHQHCGAIMTAWEATTTGITAPGHLASIVAAIQPSFQKPHPVRSTDDLEQAIRNHIALQVMKLRRTGPILSQAVAAGRLKIVGACYHFETGAVELVDV
ncbi:MAG: carbonic anhydrase [Chloroflexaceae bacterium]|nr:carbonic anhydrase [Chloroflexaceae bacterium]